MCVQPGKSIESEKQNAGNRVNMYLWRLNEGAKMLTDFRSLTNIIIKSMQQDQKSRLSHIPEALTHKKQTVL